MATLAAVICIIIGFAVAIFNGHLLFSPLDWFVAALAFAHLNLPPVAMFGKRAE